MLSRSDWSARRRLPVMLFLGLIACMGHAQQRQPAAAADQQVVRIRRMPRLGRALLVRTPEYSATGSRSSRRPREWAHFEVSFDTFPEWIDELTFTYHVLGQTRIDGEMQFSLYQTTVRYSDINRGPDHLSSVFLMPSAVARFGEPVALAVEISHAGQVVAGDTAASIQNLPDDWWRNPAVLESPSLHRRENYLVDRSRTPFAFINWDDYEVVR